MCVMHTALPFVYKCKCLTGEFLAISLCNCLTGSSKRTAASCVGKCFNGLKTVFPIEGRKRSDFCGASACSVRCDSDVRAFFDRILLQLKNAVSCLLGRHPHDYAGNA